MESKELVLRSPRNHNQAKIPAMTFMADGLGFSVLLSL